MHRSGLELTRSVFNSVDFENICPSLTMERTPDQSIFYKAEKSASLTHFLPIEKGNSTKRFPGGKSSGVTI